MLRMMKPLRFSGILAALALAAAGLAAQSPGGTVLRAELLELTGTVEIKEPGSARWVPAKVGDRPAREALISTGFGSSARLALGSSIITVRPLTRLGIGELAQTGAGEETELRLRAGRVRVEVTPPPEGSVTFTVRSPTATAAVRGTAFDFDTVNLRVREGTVAFEGAGRRELVERGRLSLMTAQGPLPAREIPVALLDARPQERGDSPAGTGPADRDAFAPALPLDAVDTAFGSGAAGGPEIPILSSSGASTPRPEIGIGISW